MTTIQGINCKWIRQNETQDVFRVWGNGFDEYVYYPRSMNYNENDVLISFTN